MSAEASIREQVCRLAKSMFDRGLTFGSSGNISVRLKDGSTLMTPTGSTMGTLDPAALSKLDDNGNLLSGDPPTKEAFLHRTMYRHRPQEQAVVHLHSTHSVAVSTLADVDPDDVLPPITAYYIMRVGTLPLVPYYPPGDKDLADAVGAFAGKHHAVLLANHGPVICGDSLENAVYAMEELEETAKLFLLLRNEKIRLLTPDQVAQLREKYG